MNEFELPVSYKGEEYLFKSSLQVTGYTHRFVVAVNGTDIIFEPDEERNYRAILSYEDLYNHKVIDRELVKAISESLQEVLK